MNSLGALCMFYLFMMVGAVVLTAVIKAKKAEKEQKLIEQNPQAWAVLKSLEAEKKERQRRALTGGAVSVGFQLLRLFLRK